MRRWPGAKITLRRGALIVEKTWAADDLGGRMPRQPYPRSYPAPIYGIAHPERMTRMAEGVGRCIMMFSYVDWIMALVLAAVMKAESEASVAIFLTLRNARAQRDVLIAAAEMTLFDEDKEAFDALVKVYASLQAQRADVAHGVFGLAPETEDEAAWIETKDLSKHWLDVFHRPGTPLGDIGLRRDEKNGASRRGSWSAVRSIGSPILRSWNATSRSYGRPASISTRIFATARVRSATNHFRSYATCL